MESNKITLTGGKGKEIFVLRKSMIGGYSYQTENDYANVFFKGGMSWPIDNTEENIEKLKSVI